MARLSLLGSGWLPRRRLVRKSPGTQACQQALARPRQVAGGDLGCVICRLIRRRKLALLDGENAT